MKISLEEILLKLVNDGYWDKCELKYNSRLINYRISKLILKDDRECDDFFDDFMTYMFSFTESEGFDKKNIGFSWINYLELIYPENTKRTVYEILKLGIGGGARTVLNELTNEIIKKNVYESLDETINGIILGLSIEDKIKIAEEYNLKSSRFLDRKFKDKIIDIAENLYEILFEYVILEREERKSNPWPNINPN